MRHLIEGPEYDQQRGVCAEREEGSSISVTVGNNEVFVRANPAGLRSLTCHCLVLAKAGFSARTSPALG